MMARKSGSKCATVVDLFCGCGGFSLGAELAGFSTLAAIDVEVTSVPSLRQNASLAVSWPQAQSYPWTSFATTPVSVEDPRLDEALRRFRRFVTAFRSHSKGSLARYRPKIEHNRMTKGTGYAVLQHMLNEGILSIVGNLYYLDPDALAAKTGASYPDCMARRFNKKTIAFVGQALGN